MDILSQIAANAVKRVEEKKKELPLKALKALTSGMDGKGEAFKAGVSKEGISFICECKKASPSKGIIAEEYDPVGTALEYEKAGADCLSVLTEPKWFMGSEKHLEMIKKSVGLPCLRKDFTVDEYMIYEAKMIGASAVLLICALLDRARLKDYIQICRDEGMAAVTEIHNEDEAEAALSAGAEIIGANSRDLRDFSTDGSVVARLRREVPENVLFIYESGIKSREDVMRAEAAGCDAVLIGETMMKAPDKEKMLRYLKGEET